MNEPALPAHPHTNTAADLACNVAAPGRRAVLTLLLRLAAGGFESDASLVRRVRWAKAAPELADIEVRPLCMLPNVPPQAPTVPGQHLRWTAAAAAAAVAVAHNRGRELHRCLATPTRPPGSRPRLQVFIAQPSGGAAVLFEVAPEVDVRRSIPASASPSGERHTVYHDILRIWVGGVGGGGGDAAGRGVRCDVLPCLVQGASTSGCPAWCRGLGHVVVEFTI